MIDLRAADNHTFPVYVGQPVLPVGGMPTAAVIVLQEIFGVNNHIRAVADSYAALGYLALAPDLFHRIKPGEDLGYSPSNVATGRDLKIAVEALPAPGVLQDIQATIDHATALCGGKVAVVGYCWGGLLTWRAAEQCTGIAAAVPYYGGGMTIGTEPQRAPQCPVLCHFGEQDPGIPMDTVETFTQAQTLRDSIVQVHTYAAGHGFNCNERGAFDAAAKALALERTVAFLTVHLGPYLGE